MHPTHAGSWLVTGQPRHLPQSILSFFVVIVIINHDAEYLGRELNHGPIASVTSFSGHYLSCKFFSGYGPDKVNSASRFQLFFDIMCKCIIEVLVQGALVLVVTSEQ